MAYDPSEMKKKRGFTTAAPAINPNMQVHLQRHGRVAAKTSRSTGAPAAPVTLTTLT